MCHAGSSWTRVQAATGCSRAIGSKLAKRTSGASARCGVMASASGIDRGGPGRACCSAGPHPSETNSTKAHYTLRAGPSITGAGSLQIESHPLSSPLLSMSFAENRFPLFRIMRMHRLIILMAWPVLRSGLLSRTNAVRRKRSNRETKTPGQLPAPGCFGLKEYPRRRSRDPP
jgi:hypothetical protein